MYHNFRPIVYRAGMIPYIIEDGIIKMLFAKPSDPTYSGDSFQLAKGKIEGVETAKEAAIREAKEEVGLHSHNTEAIYELGTFLGRTTVFVAKVINKQDFGKPSIDVKDTKWMTLSEFLEVGRELHHHVVSVAHETIEQIENMWT
jgi:8-oxo-dGTP pyrophosphatase MutT (NUDIX family)